MGIFVLTVAIASYGYLFAGWIGALIGIGLIVSVLSSPLVQRKP